MPTLIEKIRTAKSKVSDAKTKAARLEGQRDAITKTMKQKFQVKTEAGLKKKVEKWESEVEVLDGRIEELEGELDRIMELADA